MTELVAPCYADSDDAGCLFRRQTTCVCLWQEENKCRLLVGKISIACPLLSAGYVGCAGFDRCSMEKVEDRTQCRSFAFWKISRDRAGAGGMHRGCRWSSRCVPCSVDEGGVRQWQPAPRSWQALRLLASETPRQPRWSPSLWCCGGLGRWWCLRLGGIIGCGRRDHLNTR